MLAMGRIGLLLAEAAVLWKKVEQLCTVEYMELQ